LYYFINHEPILLRHISGFDVPPDESGKDYDLLILSLQECMAVVKSLLKCLAFVHALNRNPTSK
jgi:hypothetical protein